MNVKEYEISAPWGHIAAKGWGDDKNPIVLCFHGLMDNAGSFTRLIPLLPKCYHYIAVDLPGHGLSSHFPPHLPLINIDKLLVFMILTQHFKQDKYIMIGHSYGGQLSIIFAQLYPEKVEKLIMLDTVYMFPVHVNNYKKIVKDRLQAILDLDEKFKTKKQPEYTYDEILDRTMTQRGYGQLTKEAAVALLERGMKQTSNGKYVYTVDQRLKFIVGFMSDVRYQVEAFRATPVKCPTLVIFAKESAVLRNLLRNMVNEFKKMKNFKIVTINGDHNVHNIHPEYVEPHITKFLLDKRNKL